MTEKHSCSTSVYHSHQFRPSPCVKPAKVKRDGKWYCTIHDPIREARLTAEKRAQWEAKSEAEARKYRLQAAAPDLLEALQDIIRRNEIQHWFNLDKARAAVAKATGEKSATDADCPSGSPR